MPQGEYLQYGGQAIIEGVMMRSPNYFAVACRAPNGEIVIDAEHLEKTWIGRQKWLKLPFLRGSWALLDAMSLGVKAMRFAANVQMDAKYQKPGEELQPVVPKPMWQRLAIALASLLIGAAMLFLAIAPSSPVRSFFHEKRAMHAICVLAGLAIAWTGLVSLYNAMTGKEEDAQKVQEYAVGATVLFSLVFGTFLFNFVPQSISETFFRGRDVANGTVINYAVEAVKVVFFLGYIALIAQLKEVREVFRYHGAEHKAINTLEADQPLDLDHCRKQTRLHPRCGTSFAIIVLIISFILMPLVPRYIVSGHQGPNWLLDVTARFLLEVFVLLPIVAGIAYEMIRLAGRFRNASFVNSLFKPGLMSQYLTTREPREDQIEVALAALKACIDRETNGGGEVADNALESAPTPVTP